MSDCDPTPFMMASLLLTGVVIGITCIMVVGVCKIEPLRAGVALLMVVAGILILTGVIS